MQYPKSGGSNAATQWAAAGELVVGESRRWIVYRGEEVYEPQYEAQMARMQGRILPGCEVRKIVRQARYLPVRGNACQAEYDLRAAGYPDAFAGSPNYVMLDYIEGVAHA